ncbi:MAG: hypothetical protein AAF810_19845 [Cyanobacteria bacterium P01_D01_bin.36]
MSFSSFSEPIFNKVTPHWAALSQRWGLKPVALKEGAILLVGWTVLTWLAFVCSLLFIEVGERSDLSLLEGLLGGGLIGLAQWQMLRFSCGESSATPWKSSHRWLVASVLGWGTLTLFHVGALGWMAPGSAHNLFFRSLLGLVYGGYVGAGLGIAQWLAIRKQVAGAWRWVPLSSGTWAVAIALGWLVGGCLRAVSHLFISEVVGLLVAWGAIAILSGLGIVGLMYQEKS